MSEMVGGSGPPAGGPVTGPGGASGSRRPWIALAGIIAAVAAAVGLLIARGGGTASAHEVFLEGTEANAGPTFTPTIATPPAAAAWTVSPEPVPPAPAGQLRTASGGAPGLYGGTRDNASCNADLLISYLETNPDKAAAWAGVQQIAVGQIRDFVHSLTSVLLLHDTRVTNYGFVDGRATPRQSILQAGSAVLVDAFGVPRARCFCGNPLSAPTALSSPTYTGPRWPGFEPATVIVVQPAPQPIPVVVIIDVHTGQPFSRTFTPGPDTNAPGFPSSPPVAPSGAPGSSAPPSGSPAGDVGITSYSPDTAPSSGGTTITVHGFGFTRHGGIAGLSFHTAGGYVNDQPTFAPGTDTEFTITTDPATTYGCQTCTAYLFLRFNDGYVYTGPAFSFIAGLVSGTSQGGPPGAAPPPGAGTAGVPGAGTGGAPGGGTGGAPGAGTGGAPGAGNGAPQGDVGVTSYSPSSAPSSGGTTITVNGFGFSRHGGIAGVDFHTAGGYVADQPSFAPGSDTRFTVTTDPATTYGCRACTAYLFLRFNDGYVYTGPAFSFFASSASQGGPPAGGSPPGPSGGSPPGGSNGGPSGSNAGQPGSNGGQTGPNAGQPGSNGGPPKTSDGGSGGDVGITSYSPSSASAHGGTTITVHGFGFSRHGGISVVDFHSEKGYVVDQPSFAAGSDTSFTVTTDAATTYGCQSCTAYLFIKFSDGYTYTGPGFRFG